MKVILDANALMMPAQFQVDLFDELRLCFSLDIVVIDSCTLARIQDSASGVK